MAPSYFETGDDGRPILKPAAFVSTLIAVVSYAWFQGVVRLIDVALGAPATIFRAIGEFISDTVIGIPLRGMSRIVREGLAANAAALDIFGPAAQFVALVEVVAVGVFVGYGLLYLISSARAVVSG